MPGSHHSSHSVQFDMNAWCQHFVFFNTHDTTLLITQLYFSTQNLQSTTTSFSFRFCCESWFDHLYCLSIYIEKPSLLRAWSRQIPLCNQHRDDFIAPCMKVNHSLSLSLFCFPLCAIALGCAFNFDSRQKEILITPRQGKKIKTYSTSQKRGRAEQRVPIFSLLLSLYKIKHSICHALIWHITTVLCVESALLFCSLYWQHNNTTLHRDLQHLCLLFCLIVLATWSYNTCTNHSHHYFVYSSLIRLTTDSTTLFGFEGACSIVLCSHTNWHNSCTYSSV